MTGGANNITEISAGAGTRRAEGAGLPHPSLSPAPPFIPDSGVTVRIRWGHLDQMPRCKACGKVICSHFDANWKAGVPHNPDATS